MSKEVMFGGNGWCSYPPQYRVVDNDYSVWDYNEKKDACIHGRPLEYFNGMCHDCFRETNNKQRLDDWRNRKGIFRVGV